MTFKGFLFFVSLFSIFYNVTDNTRFTIGLGMMLRHSVHNLHEGKMSPSVTLCHCSFDGFQYVYYTRIQT